jgi:hypothetical protein
MPFSLRQHKEYVLIAIVVSFLLAFALTWPVIGSMSSLLVGHPGNDTWNHIWGYWWVGEALSQGIWPINADKLAFPNGGTLYFIDTMQALFSWPIQIVFGPVAAYNFVMIFQIALCGFAAWLLTWKVTGDHKASFAALFIYEMSPHLLGQSYNGISETVCAGWFPLTLWCMLNLMERPTIKRSLILGVVGAICILTSWYYGLFTFLAACILLSWYMFKRGWLYEWKSIFIGVIVASLTALVGIIGPLMSFRSSLSAENAIVTRDPKFVESSLLNHNITDVFAFVNPTTIPSPDLLSLYGEQLIIVIYLGWIAILLAGYAILFTHRTHETGPWIWLLIVFLIFSLGPYLHIGGEYVLLEGKKIPLPFLPLYKAFPIFDRISHPFRFVIGVNLVLAIMASHALRLMFRNKSELTKNLILSVLFISLWSEYNWFSPAQLPIPHSESSISIAYFDMKEDPIEGAVLDIPLSVPNLERAIYVWNQSVHNRAIPWGLNDPMPNALQENLLTRTLVQIEATRAIGLPMLLPELDLVIASRTLARQGYRYIVMHKNMYPSFKMEQTKVLLQSLFGDPTEYSEDDILVFTIKPVVAR